MAQQAALLDFRFNVGPAGFRRFKKMIQALDEGDYERAADELLDSRYANQVGNRAHKIAGLIRNG